MATDISQLPNIEPQPQFAGILREDLNYGSGAAEKSSDRINNWFDQLMLQSGLPIAPAMLLAMIMFSSLVLGGIAFVAQENLVTTAIGVIFGFMLPIVVVLAVRRRRQKKLLEQIPGAIEELARAARTGRSVDHCFRMVAQDVERPLQDELGRCARKMQLGVPLPVAIRELPERTGLVGLNLFVMTLKVHHQTGGDLVTVLERLAQAMRDRTLFLGRLRAATTSSRATAVLMLVVPPAVLAFFEFRDPGYIARLMDSSWGRMTTMVAVILQVIGSIWVHRILKSSERA